MTKPIKEPPSKYKTYWCTTGVHGAKGHGGYCPIVIKWLLKQWVCTCECHTQADVDARYEELIDEELGPRTHPTSGEAWQQIKENSYADFDPAPMSAQLVNKLREVLQGQLTAP